jgi:hypothetical protein
MVFCMSFVVLLYVCKYSEDVVCMNAVEVCLPCNKNAFHGVEEIPFVKITKASLLPLS